MPSFLERFSSRRRSSRYLENNRQMKASLRPETKQPSVAVVSGKEVQRPLENGVNGVVQKSATEAQGKYPDPPDHSELDIGEVFKGFSNLITHAFRPLPEQTGNGTT